MSDTDVLTGTLGHKRALPCASNAHHRDENRIGRSARHPSERQNVLHLLLQRMGHCAIALVVLERSVSI